MECLNPGTSCDYAAQDGHREVGTTDGTKAYGWRAQLQSVV